MRRTSASCRTSASFGPRRGYTLIELLVVIAVTASLFSLTFVAVHRASKSMTETEREQWRQLRRWGGKSPRSEPIKILFIGNSYTYTNDLPGTLRAMTQGRTPELHVDSLTLGGATLESHWNGGEALKKIKSTEWDFVVLQEQSQRPLARFGRDTVFYSHARKFDDEIRKADAITMFFMTWARPDTPGRQADWTESFLGIAKELHAECAPAGLAMEKAKAKLPQVKWLADPGGHPSSAGTYLAACAFLAAIYDEAPKASPGPDVKLSADEAATVRACVWEAMQETKNQLKRD